MRRCGSDEKNNSRSTSGWATCASAPSPWAGSLTYCSRRVMSEQPRRFRRNAWRSIGGSRTRQPGFLETANRGRPAHVLVWLDRASRHHRVRGGLHRYNCFRALAPPGDRFLLRPRRLWPTALTALRIFIVDWATFDADFLQSVWVAAVPAFVGAAAITYFVPARLADRAWTSWLLIVPIGGLVVLFYSLLQPWFLR